MGTVVVRVQARASRDALAGERDGAIVIRVTAPPVGGAANDAVRGLIAKQLRIAQGRVEIVRGQRARQKLVRVDGIGDDELRRRLSR